LIYNQIANFGETINIRLARPKIATFYSILKKTKDAVAVVGIVFRRVDAALRRDAVRPTWAVLNAKHLHVKAKFAQTRSSRSAGKSCPDNDDLHLALVGRAD